MAVQTIHNTASRRLGMSVLGERSMSNSSIEPDIQVSDSELPSASLNKWHSPYHQAGHLDRVQASRVGAECLGKVRRPPQ